MQAAVQGTAVGLGLLAAVGAWRRLRQQVRTASGTRTTRGTFDTSAPDRRVYVVTCEELDDCPRWSRAFASHRKDFRYYEVVEETILQGFDYHYFVITDPDGGVRAVQPFFLLDQDL